MYCMCISITCTVAGVGILCIVCVSLSHARWQVLIYYVLQVYLYHMHGDRCWYIMYCMCISITCTVAGVYLHRYLIRTPTAVQYIELSNMNMFAVFVKSLLCYQNNKVVLRTHTVYNVGTQYYVYFSCSCCCWISRQYYGNVSKQYCLLFSTVNIIRTFHQHFLLKDKNKNVDIKFSE